MAEVLSVPEDQVTVPAPRPRLRLLPPLSELIDLQNGISDSEADTLTARRLQAAINLRQLLNQLAIFKEARSTIHELLSATAGDDDDSRELAHLMAWHAVEDALHADDMHDLMAMAEEKAIEELAGAIAGGAEEHPKAPLEVLQARFYASYRERTGADLYAPGDSV